MCFIILGPSRKTFIFIKSRVGQFGKMLFDMSVLFTGCCFWGDLPRCPVCEFIMTGQFERGNVSRTFQKQIALAP